MKVTLGRTTFLYNIALNLEPVKCPSRVRIKGGLPGSDLR